MNFKQIHKCLLTHQKFKDYFKLKNVLLCILYGVNFIIIKLINN